MNIYITYNGCVNQQLRTVNANTQHWCPLPVVVGGVSKSSPVVANQVDHCIFSSVDVVNATVVDSENKTNSSHKGWLSVLNCLSVLQNYHFGVISFKVCTRSTKSKYKTNK